MGQLLAKYVDFSKGDAGWVDKANMQPGFWTGEQVMLYRDGSIGPRSGLIDLAPTGLPGGTIWGIGYVAAPNGAGGIDYLWIHKGTTLGTIPVYDVNGHVLTGQAFVASTGAFAANPAGGVTDHVDYSPGATLFCLDGDKCYKADWTTSAAGTLTALTSSPSGANIEIFNDLLIIGGQVGATNRIFFSAAGNFNSWPAANFVDISGGLTGAVEPHISGMRRLRDMLLVWTDIGQLFIITNITSDVTTWQTRQFMPGDTMSGPEKKAITRTREGTAWWTRRDALPFVGDQAFDAPTAAPVSFDGSSRVEDVVHTGYLRQQDFTNDRLSRTSAVSGRQEKSLVLMDAAGRALVGRAGTWSRHNLGAVAVNGHLIAPGNRGELFLYDAASTKVLAWQFELDRPPWKFSGSAAEVLPTSPLDGGSAQSPAPWFATPQFRPASGQLVSVDRIEIYFTTHATRDGTKNNHLDVYLQQFDAVDADEKIETGTLVPPDSRVSAGAMVAGGVTVAAFKGSGQMTYDAVPDTIDHRLRMNFPLPQDQKPAQGVRVLLQNLVGVSIHEVHLIGELHPDARP